MSEDCGFGIDKMPLFGETRVGGIHCPEKCRSLKHLVPDNYEQYTPLVKIPGTSPIQYRKWMPGDAGIEGIRLCDIDGTTWDMPCEMYICIGAKQVPAPLLCWPKKGDLDANGEPLAEGTTEADIQVARDAEGCCITLAGVPCLPHDRLPCVNKTAAKGSEGGMTEEEKAAAIDGAVQTESEASVEAANIAAMQNGQTN